MILSCLHGCTVFGLMHVLNNSSGVIENARSVSVFVLQLTEQNPVMLREKVRPYWYFGFSSVNQFKTKQVFASRRFFPAEIQH